MDQGLISIASGILPNFPCRSQSLLGESPHRPPSSFRNFHPARTESKCPKPALWKSFAADNPAVFGGAEDSAFRAQCMASGGESECTATFQYATALNWLLRNNRIRLAGNSVVFWAETPADAERDIAPWMGGKIPEGEDDNSLREKLNSMRKGKLPAPVEKSADSRFFVLGLAANAGRIAVRFWHESTVGQVWENLRRHQADLDVGAQFVPRPHSLMRALSKPGENGDIPANLSAGFLRAVLSGEKYPAPLLTAALNRFQNDRQDKSDKKAEYEFRNRENARAALVKAILIRNHQKEITPMLNPETPSDPYQLGRLFAVLESVQRSAHGGESPNATIRDRFIGGALSRPADVFPQLLKLAAHHMRGGHRDEKKIGEILNRIPAESEKPAIPRSFTLEEQGMFFLGYYHQREQNFRDAAAAKKRKSGEQLKNNQSAEAEKE